jgi:uncharacterized phage protein gp47/JayE
MSSLFPTASELFSVGRQAIVATPGTSINPAIVDVPGSNVNLAVGTAAVLGQEVVARGAAALRGAFIDSARGPALDRVVYDRTGLLRFSATPATVDLVLSRPTDGAGAGIYPAGSRVQFPDGQQFGLDADAIFGATDLLINARATALIAGAAANEAGVITQFVDTPFDSTLTVYNPKGAAGGTEVESDVQLIGRTRGFFPTLARGILAAIQYAALQVPGVTRATATEIINPTTGYPAAAVLLVVGDANGNSSSDMLQAVADTLLGYRAAGIYVDVQGGVVVYQPVTWSIGYLTGFDEDLIQSRISAVTVAVGQFVAPGGTLYASSLIAAARSVPGAVISANSLVLPAGDVVAATPQTIISILPTGITFE